MFLLIVIALAILVLTQWRPKPSWTPPPYKQDISPSRPWDNRNNKF